MLLAGLALSCYAVGEVETPGERRARAEAVAQPIPELMAARELDEAMRCVEEVLAIDPTYAWAHYEKGAVLFEMGRYAEAISSTTRALEIDPRHYKALEFRGAARAALDDHARAVLDFTEAIELVGELDEGIGDTGREKRELLDDLLRAREGSLDWLLRDNQILMKQLDAGAAPARDAP
jgi:tetratricopeptide (TPR) repeat protein